MPPALSGKVSSIEQRHCPYCKPSLLTSNTDSKDGEDKWKYHVIRLTGSQIEAGEPNDLGTKTLPVNPEECSKHEAPEMRLCQCS